MTTHTTRERLLVCLVVATVVLAPFTVGAAAAAGATATADQTDPAGELTLEVTNATDDTVTVRLSTTVEDVAGYQANLTFDPEATAVRNVSGGEGQFTQDPVTVVDNESGHVSINQVAADTSAGADGPTMATVVFATPDAPTDVTFVEADSLVATTDAEAVTDLLRDGVTIGTDAGDGGDGGDGSDGGDGGDGDDGGSTAPGGGGDGGGGGTGPAPGGTGDGGDAGDDASSSASAPTVAAAVETTEAGASLTATGVDAGATIEADLGGAVGDAAVTVDRLSIEAAAAVDSLTVEVRSISAADLPVDTPAPPGGDAASYVEFTTDDDAVAGATVTFRADADALGVAPEDVTVYRLVDGEWTALETTSEGDGVYVAETPGFSYFAVSGTDAGTDGTTSGSGNGSSDGGSTGDDTGESGGDGDGSGDDGGTSGGGSAPVLEEQTPGFGALAALLAVVGAALLARHRR